MPWTVENGEGGRSTCNVIRAKAGIPASQPRENTIPQSGPDQSIAGRDAKRPKARAQEAVRSIFCAVP